ncbi:GTPase-activating protein and VPS9 domain-containing protein 1 isoform X1 [Ciona intestinalis]
MTSLMELIRRLHEERLFIKSEQDAVWKLNDEVRSRVEALSHTYWVTRQHYLNLSRLIVNSSQETPALCNRRSKQLDNIEFVDGYKELGYQESMYSQFIEAFINNPTFAAACLAYGDKLGLDSTSDVARTMVMGCYGNNMVADDHRQLLELIETLMLLQLATIEQPSRLLQKGTSAFCTVFKLFAESLWSGKLFLMSALHQPIMEIIMDHELFLETNPQKVLARLSPNEIAKRFGSQDTPAFQEKLKQHVERTEQALLDICSSFVDSLLQTMTCFPQSLRWIISRAFHIVKDAGVVSESEARSLSADFLLHQFVCPAIVNPELYGVTGDVPLSDLTRFNLMQVAQVLQVMAHWNETSQQNDSFYSKLDKGPMRRLIDVVISLSNQDSTPDNIVGQHTHSNRSVFITIKQLVQLIRFLNDLQKSDVRGVDQSTLAEILNHLPDNPPASVVKEMQSNVQPPDDDAASRGNGSSGYLTPSGGSAGDLQGMNNSGNLTPAKKIFSKSTRIKNRSPKRDETLEVSEDVAAGDVSSNGNNTQPDTMDVVLVMSLSNSGPDQQPGTLGEAEVLELQATQTLPPNVSTIEAASLDDASLTEADGLEKRSRFSLYSGGSDLSEVGEELPTEDGISRTSGSSSIDLDQQEEAAVDDTSSFHAISSHGNQDDDDDGGDQESVTHANNDEALKALRRKLPTSRESIEDKMRKFEIRQELGVRFADPGVTDPRRDEPGNPPAPVDARSDTWSMDVYASDSEAPAEQDSQSERLDEISEDPPGRLRPSNNGSISSFLALARDEDSRSDVWSVEVLPSDSEPPDIRSEDRLQELESETGTAASEDVMEDNRSRASTPGLSAASGFSGVSGLSLVSDNIQAKASDEQWSHYDRSYGKGPSSISPDADDLINRGGGSGESSHTGGGGSSNSSEPDRAVPSSSSASASPRLATNQSPLLMSSRADGSIRTSASFDAKRGVEKSVAWNIPKQEDAPDGGSSPMDFEHINTIKRSPYKKSSKDARDNTSITPPPRPPPPQHKSNHTHPFTPEVLTQPPPMQTSKIVAWDETPDDKPTDKPLQTVNHNQDSPFVVVNTHPTHDDVLSTFDPLSKNNSAIPKINMESSQNQTEEQEKVPEIKTSPTEAPTTDMLVSVNTANNQSTSAPIATKPEEVNDENKPHKNNLPQGARPKEPNVQDGRNKPLDRKKSWWKTNRFPSFAKRKGGIPRLNGGYDGTASSSFYNTGSSLEKEIQLNDSELSSPGEDILQKYRQKVSNQQNENGAGEPGLDPGIYSGESPDHQNISGSTATDVQSPLSDDTVTTATRGASSNSSYHGAWHGTHDTKSRATPATCPMAKGESKEDTKRKLRKALSLTEPPPEPPSPALLLLGVMSPNSSDALFVEKRGGRKNDRTNQKDHLMSFLRGAHAEALMLHDRSRIAHLDEVLRSISQLDDAGCRAILQSMWNDCNHRSSYAAYLIRARQHLLSTSSYLQHMTTCAEMDKTICRKFFTSQCVRIFLKEKEKVVWDFRNSFMRLGASDEKVSLVGSFLSWINSRMGEDRIWEGASEEQMLEAESCVERIIFTYIDKHAMFPNGDGDLLRDQLFHQHISRLSAVLTPLHPSLQVRRKYLKESPWLSAQREARMLSAHRSPRGKLDAALRCCRAVMHLLKLADESEAPGADDFTPVLVFVLIKANPAHLLSTVQYVTSFVGDLLTGEESYWWMQFTAATEFIKTIDERK